jgi:dTDP-4-dehydrorhamnose reductase
MSGRILLLGVSGQVGTAIARLLDDVVAPSRREFDLTVINERSTRELIDEIRPTAVVNCAGYNMVDRAEAEPDLAHTVNGAAVGILAEMTGDARIPFVTFSTDYVFDGQTTEPYVESSDPNPINAYGRSKLLGEQLAFEANPDSLVIRTSWVISGTRRNFVTKILELAAIGKPFNVVNDQHGCPTIADDLAIAAIEALSLGTNGLLHITNTGATTWFDLAKAAVSAAGLDDRLVVPCSTSDYPTPARRPTYSVLGSERFADLRLNPLPTWQESLREIVNSPGSN